MGNEEMKPYRFWEKPARCPHCGYTPGAIPSDYDAYAQANCEHRESHAKPAAAPPTGVTWMPKSKMHPIQPAPAPLPENLTCSLCGAGPFDTERLMIHAKEFHKPAPAACESTKEAVRLAQASLNRDMLTHGGAVCMVPSWVLRVLVGCGQRQQEPAPMPGEVKEALRRFAQDCPTCTDTVDRHISDLTRRLAEADLENSRLLREHNESLEECVDHHMKLKLAEARVRELEAKADNDGRWETGLRNIVTRTLGPCASFDISQIVDMVEHLWWLHEVALFRNECSFGGPWADAANDELDAIWKTALAATEAK